MLSLALMVEVGISISINSLSNSPLEPKGTADELQFLRVDCWALM